VNYLSHFFIDSKQDDHYYNAALILPDIAKPWVKKIEASFISPIASVHQIELLNGALAHYRADKLFHASSFFEFYQYKINEYLKHILLSPDVNRKWFIAHVLTEILIDRQIVKLQPEIADGFYESLSAIDDAELAAFLRSCGVNDTDPFFLFLDRFRKARYIYYYADNNKFLYSLGRIMMRVGIKELGEKDGEKLLEAILTLESLWMSNPHQLLSDMKAIFK
jgi:hypothetical protein